LRATRSRRALIASAATVFVAFYVGGCFDTPNDGVTCPKVLPTDCGAVPSYQTTIAPLIASVCLPCHAPGGVAADLDLTTYQNVDQIESTVLTEVYGCLMPPADAGTMLTPPERNELLTWLVCQSPEN
jgi:hypothetical protein